MTKIVINSMHEALEIEARLTAIADWTDQEDNDWCVVEEYLAGCEVI